MTDVVQAIGDIPPQRLTKTVLDGYANFLVDDPIALVDDATVLTGSQTTPVADMRVRVLNNTPRGYIKYQR